MIDIFEYIDYRKLLKDLYDEKKTANPAFSYRFIAQKVGFSSAGFFANILQGKRNISQHFVFKFADLFKFKKRETEYFELLVNYDQSKNHEQKKYYFEKILANKQSKIKLTDAREYQFYSKWYYTAIRELVDIRPVSENYDEIARMLSPPIKAEEAKCAVELLRDMGFICKRKDGTWQQTDAFISTGYEAKSVAITNFLIGTAQLAQSAVDRIPRDKRNMGTLTVGISEEGFKIIQDRLRTFRREVLEIVRAEKKPDRIYHFNFHCFPMSKI